MTEPVYQEFTPDKMAVEQRNDGTEIRIIAGKTNAGTVGPVTNEYTHPTYLDISLPAGVVFNQAILAGHNAFIYVIEGELSVGEKVQALSAKTLGVFGEGDQISVTGRATVTRFLLVAGQKLDEPVVRGGPFVMNTKEELNQAFDDFRYGLF